MKQVKQIFLVFALMMMIVNVGWGQIAAWDFTGNNTATATFTATTFNANLVSISGANNITRGAGAAASSANNSFRTAGFQNNGIATTNTDYFQITLTATSGNKLSLSTIDARFAGTSSFCVSPGVSMQFAYSLNGTTFTLIGTPQSLIGTPATLTQIDLTGIPELQNVAAGTTVTIRYYASGRTATGGWGFNSPSSGQNGLAIGGSVTSVSTPSISVSTTSLSSFSYIQGSGPSTAQPFTISGSNLTADIYIAAPTNYEISLAENSGYTTPIKLTQSGGNVGSTTIYVRLKSGLATGNYNSENITASSTGATDKTVSCSGTVYKPEPTNHTTLFTTSAGSPSYSSIVITWTDATVGTVPDGYLIIGSTVSYASIVNPVDGFAQFDGALVKNIAQGVQTLTLTNLSGSTTYYFKIFPYTNSGANINYKTDGVVPEAERITAVAPSLLLEENFDYVAGSLLTDNGWQNHSGSVTEAITVNNSGLTLTGYSSSGIGNSALLDNNGQDVSRIFSPVASGVVYVSFMVNVATIANGYFLHIGPNPIGSTFRGRVFIQDVDGTNFKFGLSKSSNAETYSAGTYTIGTTYLIVLKYNIIAGDLNDDVSLFVFSAGDDFSTEPVAPTIGPLTDGAQSDINPGSVALRQYNAAQNIIVDGINVATIWADAPMPVNLSSFNSSVAFRNIKLNWSTASEQNNAGFNVERMLSAGTTWEKIGYVSGHGTVNTPTNYSFEDRNLQSGKYKYRLKQIDNNGNFEYFALNGEVEIGVPKKFDLSQNYPNPFNPVTKINFDLPENGKVDLRLYDMLGREVATLVNEVRTAGYYTVNFNASSLSSGIYFYRMNAGKFSSIKKMAVIK